MHALIRTADRAGARFDSWLAQRAPQPAAPQHIATLAPRMVQTPVGSVRLVDTEEAKPCVVIVPDGPNVIEHYSELITLLRPQLRVVCFDLPGFGFSLPRADYQHSLDQGASAVLGVLDALAIRRATLAFSCANGFYALRAARLAPERVLSLFLSQTPSFRAMRAWSQRVLPIALHLPVLGQLGIRLARRRLAHRWYGMALPRGTDRSSFRAAADRALAQGACFSLAGVIQGLRPETQQAVEQVRTPCTLLWGASDRTHRETDAESLRECAPGARIVRFEALGHFPDLEQPESYANMLVEHVLSHLDGARAAAPG